MKSVLLLIHTRDDLKHLDAAAAVLKAAKTERIMVLHSPAIVIDQAEASSTLDAEISALLTAEKAAADRGDYEAASGYKASREAKALDRAKTIADAWKTLPADQQIASVRKLLGPFVQALNPTGSGAPAIRVTKHQDHYDRENWLGMIQSIVPSWPKDLPHGSFAIVWPDQLAGLNLSAPAPAVDVTPAAPVAATAPAPAKKSAARPVRAPKAKATTREARSEQLNAQPFFGWRAAAIENGVPYEGRMKHDIIADILNKEFPPVATAA